MLAKKAFYIAKVVAVAIGYFLISYYILFLNVAEENVLVATLCNLGFIVFVLVAERIESLIAEKLKKSKHKNIAVISKFQSYILADSTFKSSLVFYKSALYLFYIGLLLCTAIVAAEPGFPTLSYMSDYFLSMRYGILILIAADKFIEQTFAGVCTLDKKKEGNAQ